MTWGKMTWGNLPKLSLHVPEPHYRPGDPVDFGALTIPAAGAQPSLT